MKQQSFYTWSYHVISKRQLNFYHALISQVESLEIHDNLLFVEAVHKEEDGSVTVILKEDGHLQETIAQLQQFLEEVEADFMTTPKVMISPTAFSVPLLREWYFSIVGGLSLILLADPYIKGICTGKWRYRSIPPFCFDLDPYTLRIYSTGYIKVVDPIRPQNYSVREYIERLSGDALSSIFARLVQAYPGYEGMAIMSCIQERTKLSPEIITGTIQSNYHSFSPKDEFDN